MSKGESEKEIRKQAIFDAMSARGQKYILKKGYDKWDPFQEPKDPIDIRRDKTKRTTQMLVRALVFGCAAAICLAIALMAVTASATA